MKKTPIEVFSDWAESGKDLGMQKGHKKEERNLKLKVLPMRLPHPHVQILPIEKELLKSNWQAKPNQSKQAV